MPEPPSTYPNPRGNDPWDNDAVHWLLEHPDVSEVFDHHNLFECARRQPKRMQDDLDRVILAAQLCERHGVQQVQIFDPKIGKTVWRLRRTDEAAPDYPQYSPAPAFSKMTVGEEDRSAADRLLKLLGDYESELRAAGKSPKTVFTYVDRAERFLRRIVHG